MTTLSENTPRDFELGDMNDLPAVANEIIYEGAAVGLSSGYARPLVAGDDFVGFAVAEADNTGGDAGDINVRVRSSGRVVVTISSVAVTDVGKAVFASDDNVFTLTPGSNSFIGVLVRVEGTDLGVVEFRAAGKGSGIGALTDNTGGSAGSTLAAITALDALTITGLTQTATNVLADIPYNATWSEAQANQANKNFKELADQIVTLTTNIANIKDAFASVAAKVNAIAVVLK